MTNIEPIEPIDVSPLSALPSRTARRSTTDPTKPIASKSSGILKMLTRARGMTITEVVAATNWQPHSVRAFFSGLRKKGVNLVREARKSGEGSYRIEAPAMPESAPATDPISTGMVAATPKGA